MSANGKQDNRDVRDLEELYSKPIIDPSKRRAPSISSYQSDGIYDRLDRKNNHNSRSSMKRYLHSEETAKNDTSPNMSTRGSASGQNDTRNGTDRETDRKSETQNGTGEASPLASPPRSVVSQSAASVLSEDDVSEEAKQYPIAVLEAKDTNDIVKELRKLGLEEQSDRLVLALRNRFELESEFINVCSNDGVVIVEGDYEEAATEHRSIGGLRVKGMRPKYVNYDEYDPDIINKYGQVTRSKEKMANDAAVLRRRAANMLWKVENMERMIDPNSRVRYVRHEGEE